MINKLENKNLIKKNFLGQANFVSIFHKNSASKFLSKSYKFVMITVEQKPETFNGIIQRCCRNVSFFLLLLSKIIDKNGFGMMKIFWTST